MNVKWLTVLPLGLVTAVAAAGTVQQARKLTTERDLRSYAIGMDLGNQLRKISIDVDPSVVAMGLSDALAGGKTLMTENEGKQAFARMDAEVKSRQILPSAGPTPPQGDVNKKAGEAFLAENRKKPGVVTLPSGLQYRIIVNGNGRKPSVTHTVVCQYRGTLIDGTEFDSSYARGQAATFAVSGVIRGWTEALQLMPTGSKWQLFIPPELAYGAQGAGSQIGPNATLIFEIELLAIK